MSDYKFIQVDDPEAGIRRIALNRPDKRNALSNALRGELFDALRKADIDTSIGAIIIRGNGKCFSAGYDLAQAPGEPLPRHISPGEGMWPRHLVDGWFEMWDMATPVIAQVHGYCLAGGTELATACDLVYVAEDAQIGYPPVRSMSTPDTAYHPWLMGMRRAMELMLTGDSISGIEAAQYGFANRAFPAEALEAEVLNVARRVAKIPREPAGAQQARGASCDGDYGCACRDSFGHRNPGALLSSAVGARVLGQAAPERDQGARRTRFEIRRLPHFGAQEVTIHAGWFYGLADRPSSSFIKASRSLRTSPTEIFAARSFSTSAAVSGEKCFGNTLALKFASA
jgi:enoyl-CoA hydratase